MHALNQHLPTAQHTECTRHSDGHDIFFSFPSSHHRTPSALPTQGPGVAGCCATHPCWRTGRCCLWGLGLRPQHLRHHNCHNGHGVPPPACGMTFRVCPCCCTLPHRHTHAHTKLCTASLPTRQLSSLWEGGMMQMQSLGAGSVPVSKNPSNLNAHR